MRRLLILHFVRISYWLWNEIVFLSESCAGCCFAMSIWPPNDWLQDFRRTKDRSLVGLVSLTGDRWWFWTLPDQMTKMSRFAVELHCWRCFCCCVGRSIRPSLRNFFADFSHLKVEKFRYISWLLMMRGKSQSEQSPLAPSITMRLTSLWLVDWRVCGWSSFPLHLTLPLVPLPFSLPF